MISNNEILSKETITTIYQKSISLGAKLLLLGMMTEKYENDGFFQFSRTEWQDKTNFSRSQLTRELKQLEEKSLIQKEFRQGSGKGKKLYAKILDLETENNMTFYAEFLEIQVIKCITSSKLLHRTVLRKIQSLQEHHYIPWAFFYLEKESADYSFFSTLRPREKIFFKASITGTNNKYHLSNITHIKKQGSYYVRSK